MLRHEQHIVERQGGAMSIAVSVNDRERSQVHGILSCGGSVALLYFFRCRRGTGRSANLGSSRRTVLMTSSPPVRAGTGAWAEAERVAPANAGTASAAGLLMVSDEGDGRRGVAMAFAAARRARRDPRWHRAEPEEYRTISSSIRAFISWKSA